MRYLLILIAVLAFSCEVFYWKHPVKDIFTEVVILFLSGLLGGLFSVLTLEYNK